MLWKKDVLFCELNPVCYAISLQKEIFKRHIQNLRSKEIFSKTKSNEKLPTVVSSYSCGLIKKGKGIDPVLQENKAVNIDIACKSINGLIVHPGETFSFWKAVGKTTRRKGYKDGRVIEDNKIKPGIGGGLCNLGNTINLLVLHSPLAITEFHNHSDALAPDHGERVPLNTGTSISYNNADYRFKNNTDQNIQLCLWCQNKRLYGELRSVREYPYTYKLVEKDHHFEKKNDKFYRVSKIYKETYDRNSEKLLDKKLILDNNSLVMFDYDLIPKELVQN